MSELFDKLIIRLLLAAFVCLLLIIYKYIHLFFYRSGLTQLRKKFYPSKNPADTLHLFGRIFGIAIIFGGMQIEMSDGIFLALFDLAVKSLISFFLYIISLYILDSIVLAHFEYNDEIHKKRNFAYALVSFANAISLAFIINSTLAIATENIPMLVIFWLLSLVILALGIKGYKLVTRLPFNQLLVAGDIATAFSFLGFMFGWTMIIGSSMTSNMDDFRYIAAQMVLKILLAIIIYPLFNKGLKFTFKIADDLPTYDALEQKTDRRKNLVGYGIYEGLIIFSSCFLTNVITSQIDFGSFYPLF